MLNGQFIGALLEDREGVLWVATATESARKSNLCTIQNGDVRCSSDLGELVQRHGLYEDRTGNLWVGVGSGFWRWSSVEIEIHMGLPAGMVSGPGRSTV